MIGPIILQVVLIFLNATFACAEIAVISMSETKLKKLTGDGDKRAIKLTALTEQPARFLATIQVAITLAGQLGSAFAAENFAGPLVTMLVNAGITISPSVLKTICVFVITLILAYFSLVLGELVPKRIAMKKSESMALGLSGLLYSVSKVFAPLVFLLTSSTNLILKLMGINPEEDEEKVTEEEIRMLLMTGNEQGTIDADEHELISNVFEFDDIAVEEICTHRIDVVLLDLEDNIDVWDEIIRSSRHAYYPVQGEDMDDIQYVVDTRDYFRLNEKTKENVLKNAVVEPYFIPETMKANVLLKNMKNSRTYFAIVIDEYGGLSGIITLHDLMEALVGDLYDTGEFQLPQEIEKIGEQSWRIYGYADLDDVADELEVSLPTDRYDTFNGYICEVIDRIPSNGESFECETEDLIVKVKNVKHHKIGEVIVKKKIKENNIEKSDT